MKLIKQTKLYFTEGKSDKVYEVDLCESQDLFIVNFRYGRRGANLREGTKTVFPVSYEEAKKVFDKLVESKTKKGYSEVLGEIVAQDKTISNSQENTVRKETILKYLSEAVKGTYTRNWKVSKIIARAGVLEIKEAVPQIARFINAEDEFEQYNAIQVLANFNESDYIEDVIAVFKTEGFTTITGRVASSYILKFGSESQKKILKEEVFKHVSSDELTSLTIQFLKEDNINPLLLYYAYIFGYDDTSIKEEVYQLIDKLPLKINTFKSVRYMYRTASIINDVQFFALLSKRIAISKEGYASDYLYVNDKWVSAFEEKQKANPRIAFSSKTKEYFNKLSYKKVYELSTTNQEVYIQYATQLLCSLNDKEDKTTSKVVYDYVYNETTNRYQQGERTYPKYHQFSALMYVLYGNSSRFKQQQNKWFYVKPFDETTEREDILATIWNTKGSEILHILAHAKSETAIDFSLHVIQDNPQFLDAISEEIITKLINHYHPKVLELTVRILEEKYKDTKAEESLVIKLLSSKNEKAIDLGLQWLKRDEESYLTSTYLITNLLLTDKVLVIRFLTTLYQDKVAYNTVISIDSLNDLFKESPTYTAEFLIAVSNLIGNTFFGKLLSNTSTEKIINLSASSSITNKLFAINLAKHNTTPAYELFKETYRDYIASDEVVLRKAGIELLEHFPNNFLIEKQQDVIEFCFSEYTEVRKAIYPTVNKLIKLDSKFKKRLRNKLLVSLTEAENYEGLHEDCYELLVKFYGTDLKDLSEENILELILSKYEFAQKLGTPIFEKRVSLSSLSINNLVRLAHSDVFSVREALHTYFKENKARINYELETALLVFNSNWQDVIDWACVYFDENIDAKNWSVPVLLYTCDHIKEQVQAFGRSMVTKHFSEEKGLPLLQSLQEHPAKGMQFFVTNYLDSYASDNVAVILQLESYFKTTLFYINTNRATKTRIYSFLEKEAVKNKEVAEMTTRILTAVLGTKTIVDKDKIIDILLTITERYDDVEVPLLIQ